MTTEEYRMQMTKNRERFDENERTVSLATEDVHFLLNSLIHFTL